MSNLTRSLIFAGVVAAAPMLQAAEPPAVQVRFVGDTSLYADLGETAADRDESIAALTAIFHNLGKKLPPGQTLEVQVTDVNLAGELEWMRAARRLRVLRDVNWPMVQLSYTLKQGDRVLKQGQERVSDMAYLTTRPMGLQTVPLAYEERMLERWLKDLLAAP